MPKKTIVLLPETEKILEQMGLQIKYARLRRKLTSELVAERAGISSFHAQPPGYGEIRVDRCVAF